METSSRVSLVIVLVLVLLPALGLAEEAVSRAEAEAQHSQIWTILGIFVASVFGLLQAISLWVLNNLTNSIKDLRSTDEATQRELRSSRDRLAEEISRTREELKQDYARRTEVQEIKNEMGARIDKLSEAISKSHDALMLWLNNHENKEFSILRGGAQRNAFSASSDTQP